MDISRITGAVRDFREGVTGQAYQSDKVILDYLLYGEEPEDGMGGAWPVVRECVNMLMEAVYGEDE